MKVRLVLPSILSIAALLLVPLPAASALGHGGSEFSDREIVQGILYGEGEFANAAGIKPSIDGSLDTEEISAVQDQLLHTVESEHKVELRVATDKIRTGDPYEVDEGVRKLAGVFGQALESDFPEMTTEATVQPMCGVICVCVAGVEIAVVGGIAVVAVAETAIGAHFWLWTKTALKS